MMMMMIIIIMITVIKVKCGKKTPMITIIKVKCGKKTPKGWGYLYLLPGKVEGVTYRHLSLL